MTTAEKLALIADNMKKVYDAGKAAGKAAGGLSNVDIREIDFGDVTFGETSENTLKDFDHGLGKAPVFVAIYANDVDKIMTNANANGTNYTIQADRIVGRTPTYLYINGVNTTIGGTFTDSESRRVIARWDNEKVYVNAPAATRPWPAKELSTFTMVCIG